MLLCFITVVSVYVNYYQEVACDHLKRGKYFVFVSMVCDVRVSLIVSKSQCLVSITELITQNNCLTCLDPPLFNILCLYPI